MITLLGFPTRRPTLSHVQFSAYWRNQHGPLVVSVSDFIAHVRKYAQYHPVEDPQKPGAYLGDGGEHDGMGLLTFDDPQSMQAAFATSGFRQVIAPDEEKLRDTQAAVLWFMTREMVQHDSEGPPPPGAVTLIGAARRPTSMTQDAFTHYWGGHHGPLVAATPDFIRHVHRYTQYHIVNDPSGHMQYAGDAESFGGVGLMTFNSLKAMKAAYAEPVFSEVIKPDGRPMANPDRPNLWFLAHEHIIHASTPNSVD